MTRLEAERLPGEGEREKASPPQVEEGPTVISQPEGPVLAEPTLESESLPSPLESRDEQVIWERTPSESEKEEKQMIRLFDESGREYLSVADAANRSGYSASCIRSLVGKGQIPGAIKPGRDLLVPWDEVLRYKEAPKNKG